MAAGAVVGAAGFSVPKARAGGGSGDLDAYVGELRLFAGDYVPAGWLACRGGELDREQYDDLAAEIGDNFGRSPDGGIELPTCAAGRCSANDSHRARAGARSGPRARRSASATPAAIPPPSGSLT